MSPSRCFAALALLGVGLIPASFADVLCLEDGRVFEGVKLARDGDVVVIFFEHGDITIPAKRVVECIIEGDPGFVPVTEEEKERVAKGQVKFHDKWMSVSKRDRAVQKLLAEQRARIEELTASRLWRNRIQEESKNFDFEVTLPRNIFEDYRDLSENYFQEFVKLWKIRKPKDLGRLKVKFYVDEENYVQITGNRWATAFFRFIEPYELHVYYDRLAPQMTEQVLFHELNHYLQKLIDEDFSYPHWPGEALAEYYGASTWDPDKKKVITGGVQEGRLVEIRYEDLDARPMSELEAMYKTLELGDFEVVRPLLDRYLDSLGTYEKNRFEFPAEIVETVNENWGFAFDAFGYERLRPGDSPD